MVFPWACISQNDKCDYSVQMKKCFTSSTRYMSVIGEKQFSQSKNPKKTFLLHKNT